MLAISVSHANLCPSFCTDMRDGGLPAIFTPWYEMGNILDYAIAYPYVDKGDLVSRLFLRLYIIASVIIWKVHQTADGLEHVDAMGIVHGNINPVHFHYLNYPSSRSWQWGESNVLISRDGKALITDIGLNTVLRNMIEGEILPLPRSWM